MQPLRYSINVTLDGCVDHQSVVATSDMHRHAQQLLEQADALLFGRITYQMMEEAWRPPASDAMPAWTQPFAQTMDAARKYVVSRSLESVDWNAQLLRGELSEAVQRLKDTPGRGLLTGGVALPTALAALGLIDEYEFVVHPQVAGHGPVLFAGLAHPLALTLVDRQEFASGAVALRYVPQR